MEARLNRGLLREDVWSEREVAGDLDAGRLEYTGLATSGD